MRGRSYFMIDLRPVADPEIVGGVCGRVAEDRDGCGVRGGGIPRGRGPRKGLCTFIPRKVFPFWISKWPVSVHCGCRWEMHPHPPGSATVYDGHMLAERYRVAAGNLVPV